MAHDMRLTEIRAPQASKERWDQRRIVETLLGGEAFQSTAAGGCRLVG